MRFVDLSMPLDDVIPVDPPFLRPKIEYKDHAAGAKDMEAMYGIRRDLQAQLSAEGFGVRVYIPFGREWFPYFMRRLGERPANVGFVLRGIVSERA